MMTQALAMRSRLDWEAGSSLESADYVIDRRSRQLTYQVVAATDPSSIYVDRHGPAKGGRRMSALHDTSTPATDPASMNCRMMLETHGESN